MVENLPCENSPFHYVAGNRNGAAGRSSSGQKEMTMTPESPLSPAAIAEWTLAIATRLLARSLNMPEPLVVSTSAYVYAQVAAAETRAARTLCPFALARRLRAWFRDLTA
jgi:hypothetical protein